MEEERCPCCGAVSESAWHIRVECQHPRMVEVRKQAVGMLRRDLQEAMTKAGAGSELVEALGRMWSVNKGSRTRQECKHERMLETKQAMSVPRWM